MAQAKEGDKVKVHYTGKFEDGTVFDSSREREPIEFEVGGGRIIVGFDKSVRGMEVGQSKTVEVEPADAYGQHHERLVAKVNATDFPKDITPKIGQQLQTQDKNGQPVNVRVTEIDGDKVTLDANHPLAGKKLIFDIELVEIG
jgi:FKBP-type peptidyl-prolyl cis-trans isomerase 2